MHVSEHSQVSTAGLRTQLHTTRAPAFSQADIHTLIVAVDRFVRLPLIFLLQTKERTPLHFQQRRHAAENVDSAHRIQGSAILPASKLKQYPLPPEMHAHSAVILYS
jgi:hypothetical protein